MILSYIMTALIVVGLIAFASVQIVGLVNAIRSRIAQKKASKQDDQKM